ncbi:MAG: SulP family inorganic anion transporter, partial [Ruminococcus sp.]|nr:SulP family inorganic anion transporter [Ruminococcus sp.]
MTGFKAGEKKLTASRAVGDILVGVIIALVSIPISMGYSQIAGLPAVYGLYGSVFPILIFALLSSSPQFIFGIDAAPCALVGAFLTEEGIALGTKQALKVVPVITLVTALCLLVFYVFRADRLINYVSTPVMGGFISGISTTIILMQIPKLYGADAGTGELPQLISHIAKTVTGGSGLTVLLGISALVLLIVSRKFVPLFPMSVAVMAGGIALEK